MIWIPVSETLDAFQLHYDDGCACTRGKWWGNNASKQLKYTFISRIILHSLFIILLIVDIIIMNTSFDTIFPLYSATVTSTNNFISSASSSIFVCILIGSCILLGFLILFIFVYWFCLTYVLKQGIVMGQDCRSFCFLMCSTYDSVVTMILVLCSIILFCFSPSFLLYITLLIIVETHTFKVVNENESYFNEIKPFVALYKDKYKYSNQHKLHNRNRFMIDLFQNLYYYLQITYHFSLDSDIKIETPELSILNIIQILRRPHKYNCHYIDKIDKFNGNTTYYFIHSIKNEIIIRCIVIIFYYIVVIISFWICYVFIGLEMEMFSFYVAAFITYFVLMILITICHYYTMELQFIHYYTDWSLHLFLSFSFYIDNDRQDVDLNKFEEIYDKILETIFLRNIIHDALNHQYHDIIDIIVEYLVPNKNALVKHIEDIYSKEEEKQEKIQDSRDMDHTQYLLI